MSESHEKGKSNKPAETSKPCVEKHLEKQDIEKQLEKTHIVKPDEEEDSWMMLLELGGQQPCTRPAETHPSFCTGRHTEAEPNPPKRFKTHDDWLESLID